MMFACAGIPCAVQPLEATHSPVGGMPLHEEALRLPHHGIPGQGVPCQAVRPALLCCLVPLL